MVPHALLSIPVLAMGSGYGMLGIIVITIVTIVCGAIPLITGANRGHIAMGIIGALFVVAASAMFCIIGGLPVAIFFHIIIRLLPTPNRPLLNQSEIEQEVRRIRGY